MDRGYRFSEKQTTGPNPQAEQLLAEATQSIILEVGQELASVNLKRATYDLPGRHDPSTESDDRLTILYFREIPAAVLLETRDENNNVDTTFSYYGTMRG